MPQPTAPPAPPAPADQPQPQPAPAPPPPSPSPAPPAPADGDGNDPLAQLNTWAQAIGAREKAEGRAAGLKAAMEAFGDVSLEQAADIVKRAREAEAAQMTEAQRMQAQAEAAKAAAEQAQREATELIHSTLKQNALTAAGVAADQAPGLLPLVNVPQGTDVTAESVAAAVEQVKATYPQLFTTSPQPPAGRPAHSQPGAGPVPPTAGGGAPTDAKTKAKERLYERHPELRPKS